MGRFVESDVDGDVEDARCRELALDVWIVVFVRDGEFSEGARVESALGRDFVIIGSEDFVGDVVGSFRYGFSGGVGDTHHQQLFGAFVHVLAVPMTVVVVVIISVAVQTHPPSILVTIEHPQGSLGQRRHLLVQIRVLRNRHETSPCHLHGGFGTDQFTRIQQYSQLTNLFRCS